MKPLVLVIENDAGTRKLLDVLLSRFGFEVDLLAVGSDGRSALENVAYDAAFVDLLLPGTSGFDILEWLGRERPQMLARSIVLSSAPEAQLNRVRAQWPQVRVIRKPFELGEVVEAAQAASATRAPRTGDPAEAFCRWSLRAGAKSGVVVRRSGAQIEPVLSFGYAAGYVESYFPMPVETPMPLCASILHAAPVWIGSVAAAAPEYPALAPVCKQLDSRALASVPVRRGGSVIGAAGWSFREARLFTEAEQQTFTAIAESLAAWLPGTSGAAAGA